MAATSETAETSGRLTALSTDNTRPTHAEVIVGKPTTGIRGMWASRVCNPETTDVVAALAYAAVNWNNTADLISRFDVFASSGNIASGSMMRVEGLIP